MLDCNPESQCGNVAVMSNIYSDQSLDDTDMAIEMAMTLAGVPLELRADHPVCSNVAHMKSLVPSVGSLPYSALDLIGSDITDLILDRRWLLDSGEERVSFLSLARAYIGVVGEDNITYGMHTLLALQTLLAGGHIIDNSAARRAHSNDVTRAVVGGDASEYEFFQGETFFSGTTRTRYRTTDYVLPALSALYAAGVIGTHRDIDPQDAAVLATIPGPAGFYHVYRTVYGTGDTRVPDASAWQFSLAPAVLVLAAVLFTEGLHDEVDWIIDEVESGVFTSGFAGERPDMHFTAVRDRTMSMIEFHRRQAAEAANAEGDA